MPTYLLWIALSSIFYALGECLSKLYALHQNKWTAFGVMLSYAICSLLWLPAIVEKKDLIVVSSVWLIFATIVTVLLGFFIFEERLSLIQISGVILGVIALLCLNH